MMVDKQLWSKEVARGKKDPLATLNPALLKDKIGYCW
jgi:hypothetical protein